MVGRLIHGEGWDGMMRLHAGLKKDLDDLPGADPLVQSAYYQSALDYYKAAGPASEYYRSGLMYLAYTPNESLSAERQSALAFEMTLAALVGDDVYNFGELVRFQARVLVVCFARGRRQKGSVDRAGGYL